MDRNSLEQLHNLSFGNREHLARATLCGCFYCGATFPPAAISTYIDKSPGTALCPSCGIDSVLPDTPDHPLSPELLREMHIYWFATVGRYPRTRWWKRAIEIAVALLAASIAGLTVWAVWDTLADPPQNGTSRATLHSIAFVLTFVASAAFLFAARLAFPRLRVQGGRILGRQGLIAFFLLYGLVLVLGLWNGSPQAKTGAVAIVLGLLISTAWRSTFSRKPPNVAG